METMAWRVQGGAEDEAGEVGERRSWLGFYLQDQWKDGEFKQEGARLTGLSFREFTPLAL